MIKGDDLMTKKKQNKDKLGAPRKAENPYLNIKGGIDLIEVFPKYKNRKKRKAKKPVVI